MADIEFIEKKIHVIRGEKVMLDSDIAELYGVETRRLNEQVKRNINRFPDNFMFQLTKEEWDNLMSQNEISSWGGARKLPNVFTEHGALMASTVLNSEQAVKMSVYIIKAFVKFRETISNSKEIIKRLEDLEKKAGIHDKAIRQIITAIKYLMKTDGNTKNKIGF